MNQNPFFASIAEANLDQLIDPLLAQLRVPDDFLEFLI